MTICPFDVQSRYCNTTDKTSLHHQKNMYCESLSKTTVIAHLSPDLVNEPLVTSFSQLLFLHSSFDFSSDTRMRRFLTNISRFGIFVEKIVCFTRFFSAPHWYISSRQKIKIGANIIYISLKKMISPFISGYNLVENPLIFTTKTIDSVLCDNEHKMNGKDQEMKWDRLYSTFRLEGSDLWATEKFRFLKVERKLKAIFTD